MHVEEDFSHIIDYLDAGGDRKFAVQRLQRYGLSQHDSIAFVLKYDGTVWDTRNGTYEAEYNALLRQVTTYH